MIAEMEAVRLGKVFVDDDFPDRFTDPSVPKSVDLNLQLFNLYDPLLTELELYVVKQTKGQMFVASTCPGAFLEWERSSVSFSYMKSTTSTVSLRLGLRLLIAPSSNAHIRHHLAYARSHLIEHVVNRNAKLTQVILLQTLRRRTL